MISWHCIACFISYQVINISKELDGDVNETVAMTDEAKENLQLDQDIGAIIKDEVSFLLMIFLNSNYYIFLC